MSDEIGEVKRETAIFTGRGVTGVAGAPDWARPRCIIKTCTCSKQPRQEVIGDALIMNTQQGGCDSGCYAATPTVLKPLEDR